MTVTPLRHPQAVTPTDRVALEVKALMGRYGVTQMKLTEVLGVTQSAISRRLHGTTPFDVNEVGVLANFFGVTMGELLGEGQPLTGPDGGAAEAATQR